MRAIYKYALNNTERQTITTFKGAKILSVGIQDKSFCVWVEVNTKNKEDRIGISIFYTGEEIAERYEGRFIQTLQISSFVFHIYQDLA